MQPTHLILAVFTVACPLVSSLANGDYQTTSTLAAVARECLRTVFDCVMQSPGAAIDQSRWGKLEDPAGDCKLACSNDALSITVPGTYHGLSNANKNFLAPRVLQDLAGDFSIEVKLKCFQPSAIGTSASPAAPNDSFVGSGLLIWQDEKNFIRFTQAASSTAQEKLVQLRVGEKLNLQFVYELDAEVLFLRVCRIGKIFSVAVSEDGKRWLAPAVSLLPTFHDATAGLGDSLRAGVVVVNGTNQAIQAEFKELKLSFEPDVNVHDVFEANWQFPQTPLTALLDRRVQQELQLKPEILSTLKELDAQVRALPAAERLAENGKPARDAWALLRPMLTAQQIERLAGVQLQRYGPRCLLIDIVQEQLQLDQQQLKNIDSARSLLQTSIATRNVPIRTLESESKYRELRHEANALLLGVFRSVPQTRLNELKGNMFSFNLPGMIAPEEFAGGHPMGPLADILRQPAVQQELRLSRSTTDAIEVLIKEQSRAVAITVESLELDTNENPAPGVVEGWREAYKKIAALRRKLEAECAKLLTIKQESRVQQILFQALGPQTLLVSDSARDALQLTDKQRDELRRVEDGLAKSQNFSVLICKSLRHATDVSALLTERQRETIEQLKGAPFRFVAVIR